MNVFSKADKFNIGGNFVFYSPQKVSSKSTLCNL